MVLLLGLKLKSGGLKSAIFNAVFEVVLIVVGILIAVYIDNAIRDQENANLEQRYLMNLLSDLKDDSTFFQNEIQRYEEALESSKEFTRLLYQTRDDPEYPREINGYFEFIWASTFDYQNATYTDLLSSGNLKLITNIDLRQEIIKHYHYYEARSRQVSDALNFQNTAATKASTANSLIKYDRSIGESFPDPEMNQPLEWSFLNDPDDPNFKLLEVDISHRIFAIRINLWLSKQMITKIDSLCQKIESELN